jgi:tetratricopeptide (TPR) repeat protein
MKKKGVWLIAVLLFVLTSMASATFTKEKVSDCGYSYTIILTGDDYENAQEYNKAVSSFEQSFINNLVGNEKYIAIVKGDTYAVGISNWIAETYYKTALETSNKIDAAEFTLIVMGIESFNPIAWGMSYLGEESLRFGLAWKAHNVISEATKTYPYELYDGVYIDVITSCCQPILCPADWIIRPVNKPTDNPSDEDEDNSEEQRGYRVRFEGKVTDLNPYDLSDLGLKGVDDGNIEVSITDVFDGPEWLENDEVIVYRLSDLGADIDFDVEVGDRVEVYGIYPSTQRISGPYLVELMDSRHYLKKVLDNSNDDPEDEQSDHNSDDERRKQENIDKALKKYEETTKKLDKAFEKFDNHEMGDEKRTVRV